ncbi:MAG: hypothetical protein R2724_27860 [Bryobacterales bacterium]
MRAARREEEGDTDGAIAIYKNMLDSGPGYAVLHHRWRGSTPMKATTSLHRHRVLAQQATQAAPPPRTDGWQPSATASVFGYGSRHPRPDPAAEPYDGCCGL